jgi:hypothetical protein
MAGRSSHHPTSCTAAPESANPCAGSGALARPGVLIHERAWVRRSTWSRWLRSEATGRALGSIPWTGAKTISGKQVVSVRRPVFYLQLKHLQNGAFSSALGRTRTCGLLVRSEPFRAYLGARLVPFGLCLCVFCSVTMSSDPCESRRAPAHKW